MRKKTAFTLVEIMVTILILAILAALVIPGVLRARVNANATYAKATLKAISTASESFLSINGRYPLNSSELLIDPRYISEDYFAKEYNGYNFVGTFSAAGYTATAVPVATKGLGTFTITTGGILTEL